MLLGVVTAQYAGMITAVLCVVSFVVSGYIVCM